MYAICLVCESAFEVEGELDLMVQIECPKCHRGTLMFDAEDEQDITHYGDSGIFDASPPEPLDEAASALLEKAEKESETDRWIAQAQDASASQPTPSYASLSDLPAPSPESRITDSIQTLNTGPLADGLSLYNGEPEDLSQTLPELDPYPRSPSPAPDTDVDLNSFHDVPAVNLNVDKDIDATADATVDTSLDEAVEAVERFDTLKDDTGNIATAMEVLKEGKKSTPLDDDLASQLDSAMDSAIVSLSSDKLKAVPSKNDSREYPSFDSQVSALSNTADTSTSELASTVDENLPEDFLDSLKAEAEAEEEAQAPFLNIVSVGSQEDEQQGEQQEAQEDEVQEPTESEDKDSTPALAVPDFSEENIPSTAAAQEPAESETQKDKPADKPEAKEDEDAFAASEQPSSARNTRPLRPVQTVPLRAFVPGQEPPKNIPQNSPSGEFSAARLLSPPTEKPKEEPFVAAPPPATPSRSFLFAPPVEPVASEEADETPEASASEASPEAEIAAPEPKASATPAKAEDKKPKSKTVKAEVKAVSLEALEDSKPAKEEPIRVKTGQHKAAKASKEDMRRTLALGMELPEETETPKAVLPTGELSTAPKEKTKEAPKKAKEAPKKAKEAPKKAKEAPKKDQPPMAGFGKLQEETGDKRANEESPRALAETIDASAVPSQSSGGMLDFDDLSQDFFSGPVKETGSPGGSADIYDLLNQQKQESKKLQQRLMIAVPLVLIVVVAMFFGITRMAKKQAPEKTPKIGKRVEPKPVRRVVARVERRRPIPPPLRLNPTDAGADAAPDAGPQTAPDVAPQPPAPAPRPRLRPKPRLRPRPRPRPRVRRRPRPRPRPRLRRRPRPRPRPRRRRYNRAAAKRYYLKGQSFFFKGKKSTALVYMRRAIKADPRYAPPYRVLGGIYSQQGKKAAAKRSWRTFLRLAPKDPMAGFIRKMLNQ